MDITELPVGATFTAEPGTDWCDYVWTVVASEPDEASGGKRISASRDVGFGTNTMTMVCAASPVDYPSTS